MCPRLPCFHERERPGGAGGRLALDCGGPEPRRAACRPCRGGRRPGLRGAVQALPPAPLSILPDDPHRFRGRRGCDAGDDGQGAAGAAGGAPRDRAAPVALPGRPQRVDLDPALAARDGRARTRASWPGRRRSSRRSRRATGSAAGFRSGGAAGATARRPRHARAQRPLLRGDRRAPWRPARRAAKQTVYEARTALLEMAEGREMDCTATREAISAGDRRVLRGRKLRAHLRSCGGLPGLRGGDRRAPRRVRRPRPAARGTGGARDSPRRARRRVLGGGGRRGRPARGRPAPSAPGSRGAPRSRPRSR